MRNKKPVVVSAIIERLENGMTIEEAVGDLGDFQAYFDKSSHSFRESMICDAEREFCKRFPSDPRRFMVRVTDIPPSVQYTARCPKCEKRTYLQYDHTRRDWYMYCCDSISFPFLELKLSGRDTNGYYRSRMRWLIDVGQPVEFELVVNGNPLMFHGTIAVAAIDVEGVKYAINYVHDNTQSQVIVFEDAIKTGSYRYAQTPRSTGNDGANKRTSRN